MPMKRETLEFPIHLSIDKNKQKQKGTNSHFAFDSFLPYVYFVVVFFHVIFSAIDLRNWRRENEITTVVYVPAPGSTNRECWWHELTKFNVQVNWIRCLCVRVCLLAVFWLLVLFSCSFGIFSYIFLASQQPSNLRINSFNAIFWYCWKVAPFSLRRFTLCNSHAKYMDVVGSIHWFFEHGAQHAKQITIIVSLSIITVTLLNAIFYIDWLSTKFFLLVVFLVSFSFLSIHFFGRFSIFPYHKYASIVRLNGMFYTATVNTWALCQVFYSLMTNCNFHFPLLFHFPSLWFHHCRQLRPSEIKAFWISLFISKIEINVWLNENSSDGSV